MNFIQFLGKARAKIGRILKKARRLRDARREGMHYIDPNFIYFPTLKPGSVVIDAGCSHEADFSQSMIRLHGAKAYAVDPTLKHAPALRLLEEKYAGSLVHLPFAITAQDGSLTFHESKANESGSVLTDHVNIRRDDVVSYDVRTVRPTTLLKHIGIEGADILKLDIEGAEYDLLGSISAEELLPFSQIFIEFHHHAVPRFTEADTRRIVDRIRGFGFDVRTLDDHNYLFRRRGK